MLDARAGEVADGGKLIEVLSETLSGEYGDRGFLQYSYEVTPTFRQTPKKKGWGVVDLEIEIIEGESFIISSISFSGNRLKTEDELMAALSVREGDVYSDRRLVDGLKRLYEMGALGVYGDELHPDYWRDVKVKTDEEKASVSVSIRVSEPQYSTPVKASPR